MNSEYLCVDRHDLYNFCDLLPEPAIANPIVVASRGRGLNLFFDIQGRRIQLTEAGKPLKFNSLDAIMFELDGVPNINTSRMVVDLGPYW